MTRRTDAAAELVAFARHLSARGLSPGSSGNLSVRLNASVLLTPTGSSLARVVPADLAEVDEAGRRLAGGSPTKELALHLAAYATDPGIGAVVHLHSPAVTAVSCLPAVDGLADLPAYTPYRVMSLGDVPLLPYAPPGDAGLGPLVGAALATGARALLLGRHGCVVVAPGLARAADLAEELEASARLALELAGRGAVELTPDQQSRLRG